MFAACNPDRVHYVEPYTFADVYYDYWTGPSGTLVEGEVYNEGNTFIREVELEVRFYNRFGRIIYKDWIWVNSLTYPSEISYFHLDIAEPYIHDMDIYVTGYR